MHALEQDGLKAESPLEACEEGQGWELNQHWIS